MNRKITRMKSYVIAVSTRYNLKEISSPTSQSIMPVTVVGVCHDIFLYLACIRIIAFPS